MRLKSLQLHGFKSFADKTTLEFHPGVTGIVGPNGCGKSNVVDSIKWALGETSAKALRGGEMADVIFNGTDKRQPLGMAEVTLTLTDCEEQLGTDYNEVAITRRVYRDGKGEYRINNQLCRLRDINELLMDTGIGQIGYSIMEQGKIDQLLSSKPEDRRAVFEEAAGITKFKTQKKEALRKLDYTEANLLRISDIIAEVVRQKNSLQRQAAKARRYQALHQDVRALDTHFSHRRYRELQAERAELQTSADALRREQAELQEAISAGEVEISDARHRFQDLESRIQQVRQHGNELRNRITSATNRIEFNGERTRELQSLIEQNESDIEQTRSKRSDQEAQIASAEATLTNVSENITRQQAQIDEHTRRTESVRRERENLGAAVRELRRLASEAESRLLSIKAQLSTNQNKIESDEQRREQLSAELTRLETDRNARASERRALEERLEALRASLEDQTQALKAAEREFQFAENNLAELEQKFSTTLRTLAEKSSRLEVLRQLIAKGEGLQRGTQEVLKGLDDPGLYSGGIRGVLTSFVEVDQQFIPAIECALGAHLQTILVADGTLAESIIDNLSRRKRGEVFLLAQDLCPASPDSQMMTLPEGGIAWALDRVSVRPEFKTLVQKLLADVLIVPDLPTGLRLRRSFGDLTFVTLSGELLTPEGLMKGGVSGEATSGSILQRQAEIRELAKAAEDLQTRRGELEAEIDSGRGLLAELKSGLEESRARLQETRVQESTVAGQLAMIEREIQQMSSKLEGVQWEQGELFKRRESAEQEIASLRDALQKTQQEIERRSDEILEREAQFGEITRKESESAEFLAELRTALAVERRAEEALRQQKEPMAHRLHELQELLARREAEIATYHEKIATAEAECERLRGEIGVGEEEIRTVDQELVELGAERTRMEAELASTEQGLLKHRRRLSSASEQRGNEEIKMTQLDLRIENLASTILERYQVELDAFEPDPHVLLSTIAEQKKAFSRVEKRRATMAAREESSESDEAEAVADEEEVAEAEEASSAEGPDDAGDAPDHLLEMAGEPDWDFVASIIGDLKRKLDSMGPVNLDAIEEFEELEERHHFLESQHTDLVNSKAELLNVIDKINKTTRQMFAETFEKIRTNFKQTFRELFGSAAQANLVLVDEDDPLESGIDVIAKPPGKKLQSITLLSGGERSMTAVALLFSIYMVKPSPFCVLDELDAPLDESNIGRFLKMLDRFIDQSQFIIVTHNKRTMSRADIMYGVTMQEYGISKPVGMKLRRSEAELPESVEEESKAPAANI